jgi:hypothetical protein
LGAVNVSNVDVLEVVRLVAARLGLLTAPIWLWKELHGAAWRR